MKNELLIYYGNYQKLGKLLLKLHKEILNIMLKECETIYLENHQISPQYQTYEPLQSFPEKIVKVFQYDLEWLKEKVEEIAGPEWGFIKNNPPIHDPFIKQQAAQISLDTRLPAHGPAGGGKLPTGIRSYSTSSFPDDSPKFISDGKRKPWSG